MPSWNNHELVVAQLHERSKKLKSHNKQKRPQDFGTGKQIAI